MTLLRNAGVGPGDRLVLVLQEPLAPVHPGDVAAQPVEDVRELRRDEATPDDDHAFGQRRHPHDRVAGVDAAVGVDPVQPGYVQQPGPAAGGDDPAVRGHGHAGAGVEGHRAGEPGLLVVDGDVVGLVAVGLAVVGDGVDAAEDPVPDRRPVGADLTDVDTEASGLPRLLHPVGGQDEHLGGDAPDVEAGAAEPALLDQADVEVVEARGDHGVARPRADDDEVVVAVLHVRSVTSRRSSPCGLPCGLLPAST